MPGWRQWGFDLPRAFDSDSDQILLLTTPQVNFHINATVIVQSVVNGRIQRVVLIGDSFSWSEIYQSIPQVNVKGPFPFSYFVKGMQNGTKTISKPVQYADRTFVSVASVAACLRSLRADSPYSKRHF